MNETELPLKLDHDLIIEQNRVASCRSFLTLENHLPRFELYIIGDLALVYFAQTTIIIIIIDSIESFHQAGLLPQAISST